MDGGGHIGDLLDTNTETHFARYTIVGASGGHGQDTAMIREIELQNLQNGPSASSKFLWKPSPADAPHESDCAVDR